MQGRIYDFTDDVRMTMATSMAVINHWAELQNAPSWHLNCLPPPKLYVATQQTRLLHPLIPPPQAPTVLHHRSRSIRAKIRPRNAILFQPPALPHVIVPISRSRQKPAALPNSSGQPTSTLKATCPNCPCPDLPKQKHPNLGLQDFKLN